MKLWATRDSDNKVECILWRGRDKLRRENWDGDFCWTGEIVFGSLYTKEFKEVFHILPRLDRPMLVELKGTIPKPKPKRRKR